MCPDNRKGGQLHTHTHAHSVSQTHTPEDGGSAGEGARASHLGLSLLQEGLEPLLSSPALVVVAHDQDDVVPVELAHQVEPNVCLVGVRRDGPQKGQVDTLRGRDNKQQHVNNQTLVNETDVLRALGLVLPSDIIQQTFTSTTTTTKKPKQSIQIL